MAFKFYTLEETPLNLTRSEVIAATESYVASRCELGSAKWHRAVRRTTIQITRRCAKKALLGWKTGVKRDIKLVEKNYTVGWERTNWNLYSPKAANPASGSPWEWGDVKLLAANTLGARQRLWYLMRAIEYLKPRRVLEVGSGPGVNLLPLACRFPDIQFQGVELSEGGVAKSLAAQEEETLPIPLQEFSPEPSIDVTAHRRIKFTQGNAARMPFENGQFDLVYSSLALEQMEPVRQAALSEFSRVTAQYTVMLEPFADANTTLLRRGYVWGHDYFRGRVVDLLGYGLKPKWATIDMPQKLWLGTALVVSEKA